MSSITILKRCWSALIDLYGLTPKDARSMILRCPLLISRNLIKNIKVCFLYYLLYNIHYIYIYLTIYDIYSTIYNVYIYCNTF